MNLPFHISHFTLISHLSFVKVAPLALPSLQIANCKLKIAISEGGC